MGGEIVYKRQAPVVEAVQRGKGIRGLDRVFETLRDLFTRLRGQGGLRKERNLQDIYSLSKIICCNTWF